MKHYNELPLKVLQLIIEREIISVEKTHDVNVCTIQTSRGGLVYTQGDGHKCETIHAEVLVDEEMYDYELEWDIEEESITTIMKIKQDE